MNQDTTYRGPLGFTAVESKMATGLAVIILLVSLVVVYQRLVRPAPQYSFHTYIIASVEDAELSGPKPSGSPPSDDGPPPPAVLQGLLNINTADYADLIRLPGVGPVLAGRIMEYRDHHGAFTAIDSLINVSGIGTVKLEKIRSLLTTH